MTKKSVDRNREYMLQMWGTTKLVTDYGALDEKITLQEIMHDDLPKDKKILKDDFEYGIEPVYNKLNK